LSPQFLPVVLEVFAVGLKEQSLKRFIEFPNGLLFRDPDITLQALYNGASRVSHSTGQLGLAATRWTFYQQRLVHTGS
jgi:hypothetical protein